MAVKGSRAGSPPTRWSPVVAPVAGSVLLLAGALQTSCVSPGSVGGAPLPEVDPRVEGPEPDLPDSGSTSGERVDGSLESPPDARAEHSDAGDTDAETRVEARVLTLNLHCLKNEGTPFATLEARFAAIADFAAQEKVDIFFAQEVCRKGSTRADALVQQELTRATGAAWSAAWTYAHHAWTGTPDEAEEGLAIFVRSGLSNTRTQRLRAQSALVRVSLGADLTGLGLRGYATHLEFADATVRDRQARELAMSSLVDTYPALGAIVAGDFNATVGTETHAAMLAMGYRDLSAGLASWRIDHVFLHRAAPYRGASAKLVFWGGNGPVVSDHPGVLVHLVRAAGEPVNPTRIVALADLAPDNWLAVRGDRAPLSWTKGWPALPTAPATYTMVFSEIASGPFAFKLLRDDSAWQVGPNQAGAGQTETTARPAF